MNDSAQPGDGLPPVIELAWGLRERPNKGPKRGLSLEQIVAAAVKLASVEGLAAVSMGRVASELGASTMSLYRYVSAKDELLTLMVDAGLGPPPEFVPGAGWRIGLTRWATGVSAAYRRHPWSLRVPITAPPLAPNNVGWLNNALQCLADTPLSEQQKLSATLLISGFVRNEATLTADLTATAGAEMTFAYGAALRQLIDPARLPALQRAIDSGALDDDGFDTEFAFGLERILDGLEVLIVSLGDRPAAR